MFMNITTALCSLYSAHPSTRSVGYLRTPPPFPRSGTSGLLHVANFLPVSLPDCAGEDGIRDTRVLVNLV